jgi:hypothetical protein
MKLSDNSVVNDLLANAQKMVDDGFPIDAIPYYAEGASILQEKGRVDAVAECYERIGYCHELDGRWSEACEWYSKASNTYLKAGDEARAKQAEGAAEYARSKIA